MLARLALASALLLVACPALRAQAVSRAYCGDDKRAHVVFKNGTTKAVTPEPQQMGCEKISVAADEHTVGWSALFDNYGTSYPVALTLVVFRDGKKIAVSTGQMVFKWRFLGDGNRVAVLSGPVHGGASVASLYDSRLGKRLETWNGKGTPPPNGRKIGRISFKTSPLPGCISRASVANITPSKLGTCLSANRAPRVKYENP